MKPTTKVDHPILENIKKRWSPRAFSDKLVESEKLMSSFEAARWAASCFNEQPWYFIVTYRGEKGHQKLLNSLVKANQEWAQSAPVLMLSVIKTYFKYNGENNPHAMHDLGLAMGNFSVQATELGLHLHHMAGFDPELAKKSFDIPKGYRAITAIALGYLNEEPNKLSDELKKNEFAEQQRRKVSDFMFIGEWKTDRNN